MPGLKVTILKNGHHSENPVDFCFSGKDIQEVLRCSICDAPVIIQCSWCKKYFCMHHFYKEYHDCKHYEI